MALYRNVRLVFDEPVSPETLRDDIENRLATVGRDVQHVNPSKAGPNVITVGVFLHEDGGDGLTTDVQTAMNGFPGFRGCAPFVNV